MNKISILPALLGIMLLIACNTPKKGVPPKNSAELKKYKRVGTVDTSATIKVNTAEVASLMNYVEMVKKTTTSTKSKQYAYDNANTTIFVSGKLNNVLKVIDYKVLKTGFVSKEYILFENKVVYMEEIKQETSPFKQSTTTVFVEGNRMLQGTNKMVTEKLNPDRSTTREEVVTELDPTKVQAGQYAQEYTHVMEKYVSIPAYGGNLKMDGDKFIFIECFSGKQYTMDEKSKEDLSALFKQHNPTDGSIYVELEGTKNDGNMSFSLSKIVSSMVPMGSYECI